MLESLKAPSCWVQKVWADGADAGQWVEWVAGLRSRRPVEWEIVQRSEEAVGFEVIAKRWIVERTLGWLNRCRRLGQDDEATLRRRRGDDPAGEDPCDGPPTRSCDRFLSG